MGYAIRGSSKRQIQYASVIHLESFLLNPQQSTLVMKRRLQLGVYRTARMIMDGYVYVNKSVWENRRLIC